jgi:galactokinase
MSISAFAPGRVELLGNHTDYNGGVVLSAALDLGVTARAESHDDRGEAILRSESVKGCVLLDLEHLKKENQWSDYPAGVIAEFLSAGHQLGGFEIEFSSTLPEGAGLSSSAALEVATAMVLIQMFNIQIDPMDLARLCRQAENGFVGVQCGLLDQASSVFGLAGHAVFLDCREERVQQIPFPAGISLLIVNSGVRHALTGGEYNERREMCFRAAKILGVDELRDTDSQALAEASMHDIIRRRAMHIVGENDRVFEAVRALQVGDAAAVGRLMRESHQSSIDNFENSTPELDVLVNFACEEKCIYGARLTGGGFGGSIVALGDAEGLDTAAERIATRYQNATGRIATTLICQPGDGAWKLGPHNGSPD